MIGYFLYKIELESIRRGKYMLLINLFEIIGTAAFAISGALVGIQKHLDMFGVIFLSITTSIGGGIFRDLIIGNTPPVSFVKPVYFLISFGTALFTFAFYYLSGHKFYFKAKKASSYKLCRNKDRIRKAIRPRNIVVISDAIGLGIFTAIGSNTAIAHNLGQPFLVVSMGLITGVGGGILRDVFAQDIPFVFRKEIYAVASILGALGFYYVYSYFSHIWALYICFLITVIVRLVSIACGLNLPVLRIEEIDKGEYNSF